MFSIPYHGGRSLISPLLSEVYNDKPEEKYGVESHNAVKNISSFGVCFFSFLYSKFFLLFLSRSRKQGMRCQIPPLHPDYWLDVSIFVIWYVTDGIGFRREFDQKISLGWTGSFWRIDDKFLAFFFTFLDRCVRRLFVVVKYFTCIFFKPRKMCEF